MSTNDMSVTLGTVENLSAIIIRKNVPVLNKASANYI